jgi:hypothetical protein
MRLDGAHERFTDRGGSLGQCEFFNDSSVPLALRLTITFQITPSKALNWQPCYTEVGPFECTRLEVSAANSL